MTTETVLLTIGLKSGNKYTLTKADFFEEDNESLDDVLTKALEELNSYMHTNQDRVISIGKWTFRANEIEAFGVGF